MKLVCNVNIYTETLSPGILKIMSAKFYVHEFGFSIGSTFLCYTFTKVVHLLIGLFIGLKNSVDSFRNKLQVQKRN